MTTEPLVWFITGASSGLGAALAIHVLKAGHKVICVARDPAKAAKSYPQASSLGGKWVALNVTSATGGKVVEDAVKIFGKIDVLVNNAGYSLLGAVEDIRCGLLFLSSRSRRRNTTS
jgi:NAD(P)-dependent dehydrogenase (short-subunit alcohol dehydrogenase family)